MCSDPSGNFLAITYPDGYIEIWDIAKDPVDPSYCIREHYGMISSTRLTNDFLLSSGYDGRMVVFDLHSGRVKYCIPAGERIPFFELDKEGTMVIIGTEFGRYALVYDVHSGRLLYRMEAEPDDLITEIGFTLSGDEAIAVQQSGRVIVGKLFHSVEDLLAYARGSLPNFIDR